MSTPEAEQVLADTVHAAQAVFGPEIEAIFTLGSLAHGGFAPLVSDIDVAIILGSTAPATARRIADVRRRVLDRDNSPLSARLSLFWADWHTVQTGEGDGYRLGPVDRLDLLDSGRVVFGSDRRGAGVRPSHQELVLMSADHILDKFTDEYLQRLSETEALMSGGPRAVTKAILFPVRFMYTLRTGRIGLNSDSALWYAAEDVRGSALALKALEWRDQGVRDVELAQQLLDADLTAIHAECLGEYAKALGESGEPDRAATLADRAACVHAATPGTR